MHEFVIKDGYVCL